VTPIDRTRTRYKTSAH